MIRLSKSCLRNTDKHSVMEVLDREFLGMGVEVQQFEEALTKFFGRPAVCVVNGTAALHLALQAAGIGVDDEVLVQSFTYLASFQAISATGAKPVACDVDPATFTLDWRDAEQRITSKTKAVMPVHYSGGVGALDQIYEFAERYSLKVIEDAAHAFGTEYQGRRVGAFGDVVCFSFDGIKNLTSGEGGCVVADDEDLLDKVRDSRLLGVEKDSEERYRDKRSWDFDVTTQGWRYHMSNIMASIGITQLNSFPDRAEKRQLLAKRYDLFLCDKEHISIIKHDYDLVVPHIYVILLAEVFDRDRIRHYLLDDGVQTGVHWKPNHLLSLYSCSQKGALRITESLFPRILTLPLHPDMTEKDVEYVCRCLINKLKN